MRVRGSDLWPAPLTRDLVDETHHGHRLRGYPRDARTLGDVLGRAAARVPDRDAVVTRERRLTWRELRAEVDRMAGALHARHGVKPGDRVALLLVNSVDFCVGVFACARLGAVAVTLNTKLRAPELEFMLQNSGARISSVGWPVPIAELRTVDVGTGRECAADEVGELCIRGPHVVPGYWANPEATAATMGDGWMRSGDLARIDADGYVTIMDALKARTNRGGEKIYCVEVEDVLCAHPAVLEAAVVGVADPVYGEAVKACVGPPGGASGVPRDERRFVAARLAKVKGPREIAGLDALPRKPNGKVIKSALR